MSRLRTSSELQEAVTLLGELAAVSRQAGSSIGRGERLERALAQLCARAHLHGAAIADEQGLVLAVHDAPFRVDVVGAVASILGDALGRAAKILEREGAHTIAIDSGVDEKIVVRRFECGDALYFLVVMCPIDLDERSEVEVSLAQFSSIVGNGSTGGSP